MESDLHLTRIAILEDGRLVEIHHEGPQHRNLVGSIFKGRVQRILPGMQAAFVNIGLDRDAFLFVDDVAVPAAADSESRAGDSTAGARRRIGDLLRTGQEILVQVTKEPLPHKGARVTTQAALPGRRLVLIPGGDHIGISTRIDDPVEEQRLRELAEQLRPPPGGLILRTEAAGAEAAELEKDFTDLRAQWHDIEAAAATVAAPHLLHRDLGVTLRVVRDQFNQEFDALWLESKDLAHEIVAYLEGVRPELTSRVKLDDSDAGLFQRFEVDHQIDAALRARVALKSGGYVVINPTEALVAIDVNTGRYVGSGDLEETVVKTNLEAIREIGRQIRLRDLGGIIVVDLIDMAEPDSRAMVLAAFEEEMSHDRQRTKNLGISEFGLVEMTRKRSRSNLRTLLTRECPCCRGAGTIKSVSTICRNLRRAVLKHHRKAPQQQIMVRVHPEVAQTLSDGESELVDDLETVLGHRLALKSDSSFHHEYFEIVEI